MKRISYVSMAAALLMLALFSAQMGMTTVTARVGEVIAAVVPADSSMSLDLAPQNKAFIWVNVIEQNEYAGYTRVIGGRHNDGTTLYICRHTVNGFLTPGKLYKDLCQVPWGGKENVFSNRDYQVLLTNAQYHWKAMHELSRAQVENGAVYVGYDAPASSNLYICRKQLQDGLHPGKYASARGLCYISWGGKENYWSDGFEVLFP